MNKNKIIFSLFLFACLLYASGIKDRAFEIINKNYNSPKIEIEKFQLNKSLKEKIELEVRQRFYQDYIYVYKIKIDDKEEGFAFIDNVLGKSMPITFMVIFDKKGDIKSSAILKYREPYGGAVSSEDWQSQFKGKNYNSSYSVGDEISAISGATISVNSVSLGIKKLAILFSHIKNDL